MEEEAQFQSAPKRSVSEIEPDDVTLRDSDCSSPCDVTVRADDSSPPCDVTLRAGDSSPPCDVTLRAGDFSPPCDVTLRAGDSLFPCHRSVLAAKSRYFQAMFSSGMRECLHDDVIIHTDPPILEKLIKFCYSDEIPSISDENVQDLLEAACFFVITPLVDLCVEFISRSLKDDVTQAPSTYQLGMELNISRLIDISADVWSRNYHEISTSSGFYDVHSDSLIAFLERQRICVLINDRILFANQMEDYILTSLLDYVFYDLAERGRHLPPLLGFILLPMCSVEKHELLQMKVEQTRAVIGQDVVDDLIRQIKGSDVSECKPRSYPGHSYMKTHRYRLHPGVLVKETFDEIPPPYCWVSGVAIWRRRKLLGGGKMRNIPCGIKICYSNGESIQYGCHNSEVTELHELHLVGEERINRVNLHTPDQHGTSICDISFYTDQGRTLGPFSDVTTHACSDQDRALAVCSDVIAKTFTDSEVKVYLAGGQGTAGPHTYLASIRGTVGANSPDVAPADWQLLRLGFVFGQFHLE